MKIVLVDGSDIDKASNRFSQILTSAKNKNWDIIRVYPDDIQSFSEKLTLNSLFENKTIYALEQLNKFDASQLDWVLKNADKIDANVLLFQKGEVSASVLKTLPKSIVRESFKFPFIIFTSSQAVICTNHTTTVMKIKDGGEL